MKTWQGILIFAVGNLTGSVTTYLYIKNKMDRDINDELAAIRDEYYNKIEVFEEENKAKEIIVREGYTNYSNAEKEQPVLTDRIKEVAKRSNDNPKDDYPSEPITITEEDFADTELYFEKESLDYYLEDGALVNAGMVEVGKELLSIDDTIGFKNLDEFLKDEDLETTYIRNAELATDYEVTKVSGKYSDIIGVGGDDEED